MNSSDMVRQSRLRFSIRSLLIGVICIAAVFAIAARYVRRSLDRYEPWVVISARQEQEQDILWSHNGGPFRPLPAVIRVPPEIARTTAVSHPNLGRYWCVDYGTRKLPEGLALVWAINGKHDCDYIPEEEQSAFDASETVTFVRRGTKDVLRVRSIDVLLCSTGLERRHGVVPPDHPMARTTHPVIAFLLRFAETD